MTLKWKVEENKLNFPGAETTFDINFELFQDSSLSGRKISFTTSDYQLDLIKYLNETPPYTRFGIDIRSKTKWAASKNTIIKYFHTTGEPASNPQNFRVFWSPIEKVIKDAFMNVEIISNAQKNGFLYF